MPAYDLANGEKAVRSPVASRCPESPIPLSWKILFLLFLVNSQTPGLPLTCFWTFTVSFSTDGFFTFWNALGFILDLPLFLCIHLRWHHLDPRLEINLYSSNTRLMSLDPPLDSRYILHILSCCLKRNSPHDNSHLRTNWLFHQLPKPQIWKFSFILSFS